VRRQLIGKPSFTGDHIYPWSKAERTEFETLLTLFAICNVGRGIRNDADNKPRTGVSSLEGNGVNVVLIIALAGTPIVSSKSAIFDCRADSLAY
jgi:hypothetical protein